MNKPLLLLMLLFILFYRCAEDSDPYFGFEVVDDFDSPVIEMLDPQNGDYFENQESIRIAFNAYDFTGISKIEIYANDSLIVITENESLIQYGTITWFWENVYGNLNLRLRAIDATGKSSWSNSANITIKYTEFDIQQFEVPYNNNLIGRNLLESFHDNKIFVCPGIEIFEFTNDQFSALEVPFNTPLNFASIIKDYYYAKNGRIYISTWLQNLAGTSGEYCKLYLNNSGSWLSKEICSGLCRDFFEDPQGNVYCIIGEHILKFTDNLQYSIVHSRNYNNYIFDVGFNSTDFLCIADSYGIWQKDATQWNLIFDIGWINGIKFKFGSNDRIFAMMYKLTDGNNLYNGTELALPFNRDLYGNLMDFAISPGDTVWIATDKGMIKYFDGDYKFYTHANSNIGSGDFEEIEYHAGDGLYLVSSNAEFLYKIKF